MAPMTTDDQVLAERFEVSRPRLRAVAHRMLGSAAEAEDAVQEAWLRLARAGAGPIDNLDAWLTTVVGRVCLDMLRRHTYRREEALPDRAEAPAPSPEEEAVLADSVGVALLIVLDTLSPAERLAFVLHDLFAVSFDEIAPIVGRSPDAARQLASRARRRVRAHPATPGADPAADRRLVDAFLTAARGGDVATLLTLLDPDVQTRVEGREGRQGSAAVAHFFAGRAQTARTALVDGAVGVAVVADGRTKVILRLTIEGHRIRAIDALMDPARIADLEVVMLG
jgi:RNA polymerase sigma-70 factor, ECF subfamily